MSGRVRGPGRARSTETGVAPYWRVADLATIAVLVITGSVLLVPAYGSTAPVWATAVGATLSAAVLVLTYRFRLPGFVAGFGIVAGVVLLGSWVVAPDQRIVGLLPSWDGMVVVIRGAIGGWREMLTVATPTGVAGALLVPPLIVGALATAMAGVVAATRRPTLALLIPAAALVVFALLGDRLVDPLTAAVVAGVFVVIGMSWAVWVGARVRRRTLARGGGSFPATNRTGGPAAVTRQALAARRIVISVVVLAVAVLVGGLAATAAEPARTALREVVERPTDPAAFDSPLSTFRAYTKDQADVVQLTATGLPAGARLRLAALDAYDGRRFTLSDGEGPFVRIGRERPAPLAGTPSTVSVRIQDYAGAFLPLPGPIIALDFDGPRAAALTADLRYSEAAATGLLPGGWRSGDGYTVLAAVPPQPSVDQLAAAAPLAAPFPSTVALPDLLRSEANRYVAGVTGVAAQVEAIRAGLAADGVFSHGDGAPGTLKSAAGHGLDRMAGMLTDTVMVGDQEQYAALMALMVRSIGLPARVAVGFVPPAASSQGTTSGPELSAAGEVELRGRDISAWVEVPFAGYGWVAFDPTPLADTPTSVDDRSPTERRAVTVEVPPALPPAQPDSVDAENANQRPDVTDPDEAAAADRSPLLALLVTIAAWLLLALAVLAIPVAIILGVKGARRRRRRRAAEPKEQITGGWAELLDTAVDAGYRPASWHTRTETAADLQSAGVLQVDWLAPAADAAEFSPGPVNPERARGYWREVDDRSAELLGGLPLWRRWRARLSLASMRRADRRAR